MLQKEISGSRKNKPELYCTLKVNYILWETKYRYAEHPGIGSNPARLNFFGGITLLFTMHSKNLLTQILISGVGG